MIDFSHPEIIAVLIGSIGSVIGFITYLWKKAIKPIVKLCKNQDFFCRICTRNTKRITYKWWK
jgi:hypothetical protein